MRDVAVLIMSAGYGDQYSFGHLQLQNTNKININTIGLPIGRIRKGWWTPLPIFYRSVYVVYKRYHLVPFEIAAFQ